MHFAIHKYICDEVYDRLLSYFSSLSVRTMQKLAINMLGTTYKKIETSLCNKVYSFLPV